MKDLHQVFYEILNELSYMEENEYFSSGDMQINNTTFQELKDEFFPEINCPLFADCIFKQSDSDRNKILTEYGNNFIVISLEHYINYSSLISIEMFANYNSALEFFNRN